MPRPAIKQRSGKPPTSPLPADLLAEARKLSLNVSQACELGLKARDRPRSASTVARGEPRRHRVLQ